MNRRIRAIWAICLLICFAAAGSSTVRADEVERDAPSSRGGRMASGDVVDLASEVFGSEVRYYVAAIVACESSNRPGADENWPYVGLLQIDPGLHAWRVGEVVGRRVGVAEARMLLTNPRVNLLTALHIWRDQGYGAWPVCSL